MRSALTGFANDMREGWGPLSSDMVETARLRLAQLLTTSHGEDWMAALLKHAPAAEELYRDPDFGFVLLAHTERAGVYRPPHDHGRSWVIYGVQHGEVEMGAYGRITDADRNVRLVKRNTTLMRPGEAQVYLPGDIHDTRCLSQTALLFRFTERDLKLEDKQDRQVTRYVQDNGVWIPAPR